MLNIPFTATDHLLHPHHHARPPKLVLHQGQCLPSALIPCVPMAPIHGHYCMSHGDYKLQSFLQLPGQSMMVIEDTLMEGEFFPLPQDGNALFCHGMVSQKISEILHFIGRNPPHYNFNIGSSCCAATQSITCKFTCMWVACPWTAVSSTCWGILSPTSATIGS